MLVLGCLFSLVQNLSDTIVERNAYAKVSQEFGVVQVAKEDGKRYVSFAFRARQNLPETPEFIAAIESLKDIDDIRGVHLDGLTITSKSLAPLAQIKTLERVTVRGTGLTNNDLFAFGYLLRPDVDLWTIYDAEHP